MEVLSRESGSLKWPRTDQALKLLFSKIMTFRRISTDSELLDKYAHSSGGCHPLVKPVKISSVGFFLYI